MKLPTGRVGRWLLGTLGLGVVFLAGVVVAGRPGAAALGAPQIAREGFTNVAGRGRMAVFVIANTNACAIACRVFGPQVQESDGTWPSLARGLGPVMRLPRHARGRVEVPVPAGAARWRITIACERVASFWERNTWRFRVVQTALKLPEIFAPPSEEKPIAHVEVEVNGER